MDLSVTVLHSPESGERLPRFEVPAFAGTTGHSPKLICDSPGFPRANPFGENLAEGITLAPASA